MSSQELKPNPLMDFESSIDGDVANAVAPKECSCPDCEAAVSPLAYLADLLNYSLENIEDTSNSDPITLEFLTQTFHQPFGDLPASCEAL